MSNPSLQANANVGRAAHRRVSDRLMALIMVGLLFMVGAVMLARQTQQVDLTPPPAGIAIDARELLFVDGDSGRVDILDASSGATIDTLYSGEGSFVRGVVRSLVRSRNMNRVAVRSPFLLTDYGDGRLVLSDPITGEAVELQAFGPTNAGDFRQLLNARSSALVSDPLADNTR
jgi:putative photosynthetic complex assembly protein